MREPVDPRVSPFREGAKAAVPIWIGFFTVSLTLGIAAKAHGLHWLEAILMSALVFAAPAQFAALEPLASGKPALQILLTTFLINLRFFVMSASLSPYFIFARRRAVLFGAHFISISTFILPYLRFRRGAKESSGGQNLSYFLGVALTSYVVWIMGTAIGYGAALQVPAAFDEALKFMLPGFFACMLTQELRGRTPLLVGMVSFVAAVPGALLSPDWGWLLTAIIAATLGWSMETWTLEESPS